MSLSDRRKIERVLREAGFRPERVTTHKEIWKHPDGRTLSLSSPNNRSGRSIAFSRAVSQLRKWGVWR